jgi:dimeric dUTPase (all-alpha-NTP-PPase superfamily)
MQYLGSSEHFRVKKKALALKSSDLATKGQTYMFNQKNKSKQAPSKAINKEQINAYGFRLDNPLRGSQN